jgi:ABC-type lipoprotein export system ATPase subunit/aminoglycoside phosphotransferase (APT) family kinase protein
MSDEQYRRAINTIAEREFGSRPDAAVRLTNGICNEVYDVRIGDREYIFRLNTEPRYMLGSRRHIPVFRSLGITVPEILAEDYTKSLLPYAFQIQGKIRGRDLADSIATLGDDELRGVAAEVANVFRRLSTVPNNGKFGVLWGDDKDLVESWSDEVARVIRVVIGWGKQTGVLDDRLESILHELHREYRPYFDRIRPYTYYGDIAGKNVMVDSGRFAGLVDVDSLAQGDPLEAIGRIKCSWYGTHYGDVYANAVMDALGLPEPQRQLVTMYALLNKIFWTLENGVQFNANTSSIVDRERERRDKAIFEALYAELKGEPIRRNESTGRTIKPNMPAADAITTTGVQQVPAPVPDPATTVQEIIVEADLPIEAVIDLTDNSAPSTDFYQRGERETPIAEFAAETIGPPVTRIEPEAEAHSGGSYAGPLKAQMPPDQAGASTAVRLEASSEEPEESENVDLKSQISDLRFEISDAAVPATVRDGNGSEPDRSLVGERANANATGTRDEPSEGAREVSPSVEPIESPARTDVRQVPPQMDARVMLEASGLSKTYESDGVAFNALRSVDLKIAKGDCLAIVGKSGSGKSTLMHLLACLDAPSEGYVYVDGDDTTTMSEAEKNRLRNEKFGFVFQQFFLNGRDTVFENVVLPMRIRGAADFDIATAAEKALAAVGLDDKAEKRAKDLSGGEKQRVCIARALVGAPEVIFADEPTGNLDSNTGEAIERLLFDLNRSHGITLIVVTHDPELAQRFDRIVEMKDGRIVAEYSGKAIPVAEARTK